MWRGSESELERKEGREEEDVSSFLFGSVAVRGSRSLFLQPRAHSKPLSSKLLLAFFLSLSLSRFFFFFVSFLQRQRDERALHNNSATSYFPLMKYQHHQLQECERKQKT